jgi:hypothetical protein
MSYSTEISKTLADTLTGFVSLNSHQLVGHAANLDFWLVEVRHCVEVIEGYRKRFDAMKSSQVRYVTERGTLEFSHRCGDDFCPICAQGQSVSPPRPIRDQELKEAVRELRDAAYHFLVRCYRAGFIDEARFREAAESIGTGIDVCDLKR